MTTETAEARHIVSGTSVFAPAGRLVIRVHNYCARCSAERLELIDPLDRYIDRELAQDAGVATPLTPSAGRPAKPSRSAGLLRARARIAPHAASGAFLA